MFSVYMCMFSVGHAFECVSAIVHMGICEYESMSVNVYMQI